MTINTLEYIHRLLKDEVVRAAKDYNGARKLRYEYEEHGADAGLCKRQEEAADKYLRIKFDAERALEDFETHEW